MTGERPSLLSVDGLSDDHLQSICIDARYYLWARNETYAPLLVGCLLALYLEFFEIVLNYDNTQSARNVLDSMIAQEHQIFQEWNDHRFLGVSSEALGNRWTDGPFAVETLEDVLIQVPQCGSLDPTEFLHIAIEVYDGVEDVPETLTSFPLLLAAELLVFRLPPPAPLLRMRHTYGRESTRFRRLYPRTRTEVPHEPTTCAYT